MELYEQIALISIILITLPSAIVLIMQAIFYIIGKRKSYTDIIPQNIVKDKVSVIIPVRNEPPEILDDALKHLSTWNMRKRLEIIIVADDDENHVKYTRDVVEKWKKKLNIIFLWRSFPRGYRTGALNDGLMVSTGKYIYVMDVDSRISEDTLLKAISILNENKQAVAIVIRWKGLNRDTRLSEAISTAMDFIVDSIYRGRASLKLPVFPTGTGTVYRSSYLKEVLHGWDENRIQDDMEIGARIMSYGLKVLYIDNDCVFVEVPRRFRSFRIQQERWVYGTLDVVITRFKEILTSKMPWYAKLEALTFLLQYVPLFTTCLGLLIIIFIGVSWSIDPFKMYWYLPVVWFISAIMYASSFIDSARNHGLSTWRALVNLGRISAATVAITPTIVKATIKALLRRKMVYKRTPKGSFEAILTHRLRLPSELLMGIVSFFSAILFIIMKLHYSGLWLLAYSLGYIYSFIRWGRDILFK